MNRQSLNNFKQNQLKQLKTVKNATNEVYVKEIISSKEIDKQINSLIKNLTQYDQIVTYRTEDVTKYENK